MTAIAIALEALSRIAERGAVFRDRLSEPGESSERVFRCRACNHKQEFDGRCANRDCLSVIAHAAILDVRRAS